VQDRPVVCESGLTLLLLVAFLCPMIAVEFETILILAFTFYVCSPKLLNK